MKIRLPIILLSGLAALTSQAATPVYPLTENSWDNPGFVERFTGTYAFDLEINPKISKEESELLQQVAPMIQNNPSSAIRIIREFINTREAEEETDYSAALDYTIGSILLQTGQSEAALAKYREAIEKFPNFYRAYQNLGLGLVQAGEYEEALEFLTTAIEIGGGNGTLFGLTGYCFLNTNRPSLALEAYSQALIFQPDSNDWRLGKLSSLLGSREYGKAVALLDELIAESPETADYWLQQANAFMSQEQYLDALANLEFLTRLGNPQPQALLLLGDLYVNEGLERIAVDHYIAAMETKEIGSERLLRTVSNLAARNVPAEAARFLEALRREYADNLTDSEELSALNLEARLALARQQREEAAAILEKIVARDPLNGKALVTLGDFHRDAGEFEEAEMRYKQAIEDEDERYDALVALARLKISQREYRDGVEYLKRAQAIEPRAYLADYIEQVEAVIRSSNS